MENYKKKVPQLSQLVAWSPLPFKRILRTLFSALLLNGLLLLIPSLLVAYEPMTVSLPYQEKGVFLKSVPKAYEYTFSLEPGQSLSLELLAPSGLTTRLWEMGSNSRVKRQIPFPLETKIFTPTDRRYFLLEFRSTKDQIPFILQIQGKPMLPFPVEGRTQDDIKSFVGDERDEGIRLHEGVDVMAPRKTPLLAMTNGIISDTGTQRSGGKFVMLRDEEHRIHYYYAHLDSIQVKEGQKVKVGDLVGTVGDTGNARKGDYHLHLGVYDQRFAFINPYYYIAEDPLPEVLEFETSFTFPLPFDAWVIVRDQRFHIQGEEEGFLLKREHPLLVVGNSSQGTKVILNQNVIFLDLTELSEHAKNTDETTQ